MAAFKNLTGQRFGRLTPQFIAKKQSGKIYWECLCDCGNVILVQASKLLSGNTRSCKCLSRELATARALTHGEAHRITRTVEYTTWATMIQRCYDPKCRRYKDYGGRGITVCDEWRQSYPAFLAYISRRPSKHHSIERLKNDKGYEPGNVNGQREKNKQIINATISKSNTTVKL